MRGMDRVDSLKLFPRVKESITRGHKFKVRGARFKGDVRGKFFTRRVVGAWNLLPGEVVEVDAIVTFKGCLGNYMNRMGREGYGPRKGRGFWLSPAAWSVQAWRAEGPVPVL